MKTTPPANIDQVIQQITTYITHSGKMHVDEILAYAMLLIIKPKLGLIRTRDYEEILRKIDDPTCVVCDVGWMLDYERLCFDQHNNPYKDEQGILMSSSAHIWEVFGGKIIDKMVNKTQRRSHSLYEFIKGIGEYEGHSNKEQGLFNVIKNQLLPIINAQDNGQLSGIVGFTKLDNPEEPGKKIILSANIITFINMVQLENNYIDIDDNEMYWSRFTYLAHTFKDHIENIVNNEMKKYENNSYVKELLTHERPHKRILCVHQGIKHKNSQMMDLLRKNKIDILIVKISDEEWLLHTTSDELKVIPGEDDEFEGIFDIDIERNTVRGDTANDAVQYGKKILKQQGRIL
ncbi:MAG: hypothetical protein GY827_11410 [Cytophagales bacterium]|nr:hypothetical protein [Cytophagales bacterium]